MFIGVGWMDGPPHISYMQNLDLTDPTTWETLGEAGGPRAAEERWR